MYLRDYYCSTVSKAGYYWHPVDLLVQSGILHSEFEVKFIDAIAGKISPQKCLQKIIDIHPDAVLFLSGTQSWTGDFAFLKKVKEATGACLVGSGEIFLSGGAEILNSQPFLNGAILDFTNSDFRFYLEGKYELIEKMIFKVGSEVIIKKSPKSVREFTFPSPQHHLFVSPNYCMPFVPRPFATVLTDYGCPYSCSFCNSGSFGYKARNLDNAIQEIHDLSDSGIKSIFVKNMTFAAERSRAWEFCQKIIDHNIKIIWNCYSRTDLIDEDLLQIMKAAGCRLIQFGVESVDEELLRSVGKCIPLDITLKTFDLCKRNNILTGAHFIFGLSESDINHFQATSNFIKRLKPSYISINIFSPRLEARLKNKKSCDNLALVRLQNQFYRNFYFNLDYLLTRLFSIKYLTELFDSIKLGFSLTKRVIIK
ncbi:MAG: radical SAM protein [Proteobacteria bacterium]|nr:radical SAM protein [Pseudomonadota bacterium]